MTLNKEQDDDDRTAAAKKLYVSRTGQQNYSSVNLGSPIPSRKCKLPSYKAHTVWSVMKSCTEQKHIIPGILNPKDQSWHQITISILDKIYSHVWETINESAVTVVFASHDEGSKSSTFVGEN